MTMVRVYADFQNLDDENRLRLTCAGTRRDLERHGIELREGLKLTLYTDDATDDGQPHELLAEGIVEYNEAERCWVARIDWQTVRHASEEKSVTPVTACHEAAHAVCAYLLGVPLKSVWLLTDGSGDGGFDTSLKLVCEKNLWPECAVVAAVGRAAELHLFGQDNNLGAHEDDKSLINKAAMEIFPGEDHKAKRTEFKRSLPRLANEVMQTPRFFDAVKAVAQELEKEKEKEPEKKKELDGKRLEAIVQPLFPDVLAIRSATSQRLRERLSQLSGPPAA